MIWIRADANKEIGSGHVMRCISVAAALKKCGEKVCFIVAGEGAKGLLETSGQEYKVLHSAYNDMEGELEALLDLSEKEKPEVMLVDSYFVTEKYLNRLRERVKTVYIDDVPRFRYPVDMLINYNIYGDDLSYGENISDGKRQLLLGPSYAPLREQFRNQSYEVRPEVKDVLITTGGSDKYNLAGKLLEEVLGHDAVKKLRYHVVSGTFNPNYAKLEDMAEKNSNIYLYRNVANMAELMQKCDIAITAGGSTMYELSAVGVPVLCFSFVDNQELIVDTFYKKGYVTYGGNYLKEGPGFAGNVVNALHRLISDEELRKELSRKERSLVDGQGAARIAAAIVNMKG